MQILRMKSGHLQLLNEIRPAKEREDVQNLVEDNLEALMGLRFLKSEFNLKGKHVDTLAFDDGKRAFVIIEYKKDRNVAVIDQGYDYLALAENNPSELLLCYREQVTDRNRFERDEIDWSGTRVAFVGPEFTQRQMRALGAQGLRFELWEIRSYSGGIVTFRRITLLSGGTSDSEMGRAPTVEGLTRYSEDDHLKGKPPSVLDLYQLFKARLLDLGEVEVVPLKKYIGFKSKTNFADVRLQSHGLKVWINLNKGQLHDPRHTSRDVSKKGHWGNGDYELFIRKPADVSYAVRMVRQSYERHLAD